MDELWTTLPLSELKPEDEQVPSLQVTQGLHVEASTLQAEFEMQTNHLSDVKAMHQHVLVAAGMIPETNLHAAFPDRALEWVVESLHGIMNPDGLAIPCLGVTQEAIQLNIQQTEASTQVRLVIQDGENEPLVRDLPLPAQCEPKAHFIDGYLHLRW